MNQNISLTQWEILRCSIVQFLKLVQKHLGFSFQSLTLHSRSSASTTPLDQFNTQSCGSLLVCFSGHSPNMFCTDSYSMERSTGCHTFYRTTLCMLSISISMESITHSLWTNTDWCSLQLLDISFYTICSIYHSPRTWPQRQLSHFSSELWLGTNATILCITSSTTQALNRDQLCK